MKTLESAFDIQIKLLQGEFDKLEKQKWETFKLNLISAKYVLSKENMWIGFSNFSEPRDPMWLVQYLRKRMSWSD